MNSRRQWFEFSGLTALSFLALCLLSSVPISIAVKSTLTFVYLAFCGSKLMAWLLPMSSVATNLGLGLTSTVILWTVADQTLRTWQYRGLAILTPVLIVAALRPARNRRMIRLSDEGTGHYLVFPITIALLSVLLLAHVWPWILLFALGSLLAFIMIWARNVNSDFFSVRPQNLVLTALLPIVGLVVSLVTREKLWWLPKYGLDEYELHSNSVFEWGPTQDHYAAGVDAGYQWFHLGFSGLLENFVSATDWVVGTRIDFIVGAVLVSILLFGFNSELTQSRSKILLATVWTTVFATPLFYPNHWGVFAVNHRGVVAALCLGVLTAGVSWSKHQYSWNGLIPLWLCVFAMTTSKTVAAVPLGLILGATMLFAMADRAWSQLAKLTVLGTAIVMSLVLTVRSSSGLTFQWNQPGRAIAALYLGTDLYIAWVSGSILSKSLLGIILLVFTLGVSMCGIVVALSMIESRDTRRLGLILSLALVGGLVVFIFGSRMSDTHFHFLQVPVTLMIPIGATISTSLVHNLVKRRDTSTLRGAPMICAVLICLGVIGFASCFIESDPLLYRIGASTVCLSAAVSWYVAIRSRNRCAIPKSLSPWRTVTTAVFIMGFFLGLGNWISLKDQSLFKSGVAMGQLGSTELRDISEWISKNSSTSEIFATNISLDMSQTAECATSIALSTKPPDNPITVSTLIKRRLLIIRPEIIGPVSGQDFSERVKASVEFACTGSNLAADRLHQLGADWYFAYLPNANLSLSGEVDYRTENYGVISLKSP